MKRSLSIFILAGLLGFAVSGALIHAQIVYNVFTIDLSLGITHPQVKALQELLNKDPETRVSEAGVGAPGEETDYFGSRTASAVSRFQQKYASEVLVPAGVSFPTGRVGSFTRLKLNELAQSGIYSGGNEIEETSTNKNYRVTAAERIDIYATDKKISEIQDRVFALVNEAVSQGKAPTQTSLSNADIGDVIIKEASINQGVPGTKVELTATGLSTSMSIYFGSEYIVRNVKPGLVSVSFTVPSLPPGRYDMVLKTDKGISNSLPFIITSNSAQTVSITSVSPSVISYGDTITLSGSGFSKTGNEVVFQTHKIQNVTSSDGKTLKVPVSPESLRESAKAGNGKQKIPIYVRVISSEGISNAISFTLNL